MLIFQRLQGSMRVVHQRRFEHPTHGLGNRTKTGIFQRFRRWVTQWVAHLKPIFSSSILVFCTIPHFSKGVFRHFHFSFFATFIRSFWSTWVYMFAVRSMLECPISFCAVRMSMPFRARSEQYSCLKQYGTRSGASG